MSQALAAQVENPAFFDPFECYRAAIKGARSRNHLAIHARLAGDATGVTRHIDYRDWLMSRARQWHDMIDFTGDEE